MQDILWTRGLAWAWRYACVQEVNLGSRLVAVLASRRGLDLGDIRSGGNIWSMWYMCMNTGAGTWGREWATVCGAAGLGYSAVMAQHCVRVVELLAPGVQQCVQKL